MRTTTTTTTIREIKMNPDLTAAQKLFAWRDELRTLEGEGLRPFPVELQSEKGIDSLASQLRRAGEKAVIVDWWGDRQLWTSASDAALVRITKRYSAQVELPSGSFTRRPTTYEKVLGYVRAKGIRCPAECIGVYVEPDGLVTARLVGFDRGSVSWEAPITSRR